MIFAKYHSLSKEVPCFGVSFGTWRAYLPPWRRWYVRLNWRVAERRHVVWCYA